MINNPLKLLHFPIDIPENFLEKAEKLKIDVEKIEESFVHGSGPGGQKINKTANCVRLHYAPLEVEVRCQKHRERSRNRLSAYKLLINKIEEKILGKKSAMAQKRFKIQKQKKRRSRKSKEKMLKEKHHRSGIKENRKRVDGE